MKNHKVLSLCVIMLILGVVLPFLMVVQILPSSFWLNFLAFGMSVAGLFLGIYMVAGGLNDRDIL